MDIKLFGSTISVTTKREAQHCKDLLKKTLQELSNPFIINTMDMLSKIKWSRTNEKGELGEIINPQSVFYGFERYVESLAQTTGKGWKLLNVTTKDEAWGKWRNEGLTAEYYFKLTLKPEIQRQIAQEIESSFPALQLVEEEWQRNAEEKEKRRQAYVVTKVYEFQKPTGGENGLDGLYDADTKRQNRRNHPIYRTKHL